MYPNQNSKFNFNPGQFWTTGSWHQIVNYDVMHKHTYVLALAFASFTNITRSYYRKENAASPPRAGTMRNLLNKGSLCDPVSPGRDQYEEG